MLYFYSEKRRGDDRVKQWNIVFVCILAVVFFMTGCTNILEHTETHKNSSVIRHEEKADRDFIDKTKVTFDGGEAVIGLYDDTATREFMEWQPIVFTMEHTDGMIQMTGFPEATFQRDKEKGLTPRTGDIALNLEKKSVIIYLQDKEHSDDLIPIGRVVSGIEDLSATKGVFQAYLMPTKKQGKAKL